MSGASGIFFMADGFRPPPRKIGSSSNYVGIFCGTQGDFKTQKRGNTLTTSVNIFGPVRYYLVLIRKAREAPDFFFFFGGVYGLAALPALLAPGTTHVKHLATKAWQVLLSLLSKDIRISVQ